MIRFLTLLMLCVASSTSLKDGLYSTEDDDVIPLNNNTFQSRVIHSKRDVIWVVEFYNSWCGHCIHFAPIWKKVADDFKGLRDLVPIAGIDCSQSANLEICRTFNIGVYPTVKIIPPVNSEDRLNKTVIINTQDLLLIEDTILDHMTSHAPESWPRLQPLEKIEELWSEKKDSHKYITLIFEEDKSPVGRQVILDMRDTPSLLVRRMLKEKVLAYGVTKFPSLYKINPDSTYSLMTQGSKMAAEDRILFVKKLRALVGKEEEEKSAAAVLEDHSKKPDSTEKPQQLDNEEQKPKYNSSVVSMQDLESALHYSFRQEVAISKSIEGEKLAALKDFVDILRKYFPGREPVRGFLNKAYEVLTSLTVDSLSGEEWMDKIDHIQDSDIFLPGVVRWESCLGSSPRYRGYPCSMWVLFHTLTVSAYSQNTGARPGNPQEVLLAIRGYMKHFFGCQECSRHFLAMVKSMEANVKDFKDSVLWLWSAHNKVNKRLHGDASEDPEFPKIQFPLEQMCPKCQTVTTSEDGSTNFSWNLEKVLDFLSTFYFEKNIVSSDQLHNFREVMDNPESVDAVGIDKTGYSQELDWWEQKQKERDLKQIWQLREKKREKTKRHLHGGLLKRNLDDDTYIDFADSGQKMPVHQGGPLFQILGLTHLDFSMCILFYLVSTVVILLLYHHFIVRRRMSPCRRLGSFS